MAGDWRGMPGNENVFERLIELIASGGTIAFVGVWSNTHLPSATGGYAIWRGAGSVSRFRNELFRPPARDLQ